MRLGLGIGLGFGGPAAAWTPASVADLLAAWEVRSGKVFQERTGASATTPAALATDPIGTVAPAFGTSIYATAAADANRPLLDTTGGVWSATFDGVNDYLVATGLTWASGPHTIYAVANMATGRDCAVAAEAGSGKLGYGWSSAVMRAVWTDAAAQTATGTAPDGTRRRWAWRSPGLVAGVLEAWTARRDGTDVVAAGSFGSGITSGTATDIGRSTSEMFNAGLYALLVSGRVLSDAELDLLDTYYA